MKTDKVNQKNLSIILLDFHSETKWYEILFRRILQLRHLQGDIEHIVILLSYHFFTSSLHSDVFEWIHSYLCV